MNDSFTVETLPSCDFVQGDEVALRVRGAGLSVTCTLRRVGTPVSLQPPARLAAVLADLLRPGWEARAHALSIPVVRDGIMYRGFQLERPSRLDGADWALVAITPAPLGETFDWREFARQLSGIHFTVFGSAAHV